MSDSAPDISQCEFRIPVSGGTLFAMVWSPAVRSGQSAPILLFHDSLGSVALWRDFPQSLALATGRRVIAYDRLGFGRSDSHPGRLDLDFIAAEAQRVVPVLCRHLELPEIIACGHSVGGGMAIETAAFLPTCCRALVTIAAQTFAEDKTLAAIRVAEREFQDPANLARLSRYHGDKARWVVDAWTQSWLAPGFAAWTLDTALAAVRCPVLVIHGEQDEYGSAEHPRRIAAGRGTAHILPSIGHVPQRENPALVTSLIARFLAALPSP